MIKKIIAFAIFFIVFFSIYWGMNYFVYLQLLQLTVLNDNYKILSIFFWIGGSSYVIGRLIKNYKYSYLIVYFGSIWMGALSISLTVFLIKEVFIFLFNLSPSLMNMVSLAAIGILTLISFVNVKKGPIVKNVTINHSHDVMDNLSIVHLSDIHLGVLTSKKWVGDLVRKVNQLQPDLILITGDMLDDKYDRVKKFVPIISKFKASKGIFAVSGNHELYSGMEDFYKFCQLSNITVLDDRMIPIGTTINLIGVNGWYGTRKTVDKVNLTKLLEGINKEKFNILLAHQPVFFKQMVNNGISLQLSGHTHRGQIPPLNLIVSLYYRYSYGLYSFNNSFIYTSSGTGTWGPPMRLFSRSEIVNIKI